MQSAPVVASQLLLVDEVMRAGINMRGKWSWKRIKTLFSSFLSVLPLTVCSFHLLFAFPWIHMLVGRMAFWVLNDNKLLFSGFRALHLPNMPRGHERANNSFVWGYLYVYMEDTFPLDPPPLDTSPLFKEKTPLDPPLDTFPLDPWHCGSGCKGLLGLQNRPSVKKCDC